MKEQGINQKYEQQLSFLEDEAVQANLKRILADEKIHANIFQMIIMENISDVFIAFSG